jgi:hypothetical protein
MFSNMVANRGGVEDQDEDQAEKVLLEEAVPRVDNLSSINEMKTPSGRARIQHPPLSDPWSIPGLGSQSGRQQSFADIGSVVKVVSSLPKASCPKLPQLTKENVQNYMEVAQAQAKFYRQEVLVFGTYPHAVRVQEKKYEEFVRETRAKGCPEDRIPSRDFYAKGLRTGRDLSSGVQWIEFSTGLTEGVESRAVREVL